jgi:TPR repeat protein
LFYQFTLCLQTALLSPLTAPNNAYSILNDADYSNAAHACQQAAIEGDAASQSLLGELYDSGQGFESWNKTTRSIRGEIVYEPGKSANRNR